MNLKKLLFLSFLFSAWLSNGQAVLSEHSEITIMTLGPDQAELYSAFGHSAIHVKDTVQDIDWVFNYGVFDFGQKNFFWNFARGKMLYQLGLSRYDRFRAAYEEDNRFIIEQKLNFTQAENQQLFIYLMINYQPENREYYYNYVYDNCATKMRDVLREAFPEKIQFDLTFKEEGVTVRDLMDRYLTYQPWGDWIIDIGLGQQIDQEADAEEYMFLPDYIARAFERATFQRDTVSVPLVAETIQVYSAKPEQLENAFLTPFNFFVILFFVVGFITNRDFKKQKRTKWVDPILFTLAGLLGWWLVFLWFGTDHLSKNNLNLLWAIPLYIPFCYLLGVKKLQPFLMRFFLVTSCWYLILIVIWGILPQPLHNAILPLVITMMLRGFYIYFDLQKQLTKSSR